jgi:lysophospholipase
MYIRFHALQLYALLVTFPAAEAVVIVEDRALPDSPSAGYAPAIVNCPSDRPVVRSANGLSTNETLWLKARRNQTMQPMQDFLTRMNISGFDAAGYIQQHAQNATALPNIAIAASGGGYRAFMNGGGAFKAFDNRTANSTNKGQLGGLLQASTYVAGLSGGSWLVASIFANNFSSVEDLQADTQGSVYQLDRSIFQGPAKSGISIVNEVTYFGDLNNQVSSKANAGFDVTLTDFWARALSFQFINALEGGPAYTWSSIAEADDFLNGEIPMPILLADARAPGETIISLNATNFEFNPFEMGSWDPTTYGFVPTRYLGSNFSRGIVPGHGNCVRGFDNVAFVFGTSSSLFNTIPLDVGSLQVPDFIKTLLDNLFTGSVSANEDDIASYDPNPFLGWNNKSNPSAQDTRLTLVDGGEDNQNLPLNPLIQPSRAVDVIFAIDSSADINNYPNGSALRETYQRSLNSTISNHTSFPAIPDANTFINLGLNTKPSFFGCNSSNTTGPTPLIVYIANTPFIFKSNLSTFQLTTSDAERDLVIENGYLVATQANGTVGQNWPTCVGCAVLSRSFDRTGTKVPDACQACFQEYCWDGTLNTTTAPPFEPNFILAEVKVAGAGQMLASRWTSAIAAVVVLVGILA